MDGTTKSIRSDLIIPRPSVYGIIIQRGKLLLVTMSNGKYFFPGGGISSGETIEKALKREVREETGLTILSSTLFSYQEDYFYYTPKKRAYHGMLIFFLCTVRRPAHIPPTAGDPEAHNPQWYSITKLRPRELFGKGKAILRLIRSDHTVTTT